MAFGVLTFPRSNAVEERVFSMTKKNKTTFQWCLDQKTPLNSFMAIKMNQPEILFPSIALTYGMIDRKKCKSDCDEHNRQHRDKKEI